MNLLFTHAVRASLVSLVLLASAALATTNEAANGLSLRQAVQAALEGNPTLQTFEFRLRAQDARTRQAGLRPAAEMSLDVENFAGSGDLQGLDAAEATLALSQVVELGGKRGARIGTAEAERVVLDSERQAAQLDVLAEVTRRFVVVVQRQRYVGLAREAVGLAEKTVKTSGRRVAAAKAPHAELDRARIALHRTQLEERAALAELDTARKRLAATWGESEPVIRGQPIGEAQADLLALPSTGEFSQLVRQLADNPDFLRFSAEARLRDAQWRLADALRRPDVTLGAGIRQIEGSSDRDQALVASLSVPLFTGSRAASLVAEARANRDLVDAERRVAEVNAEAVLYELHRQLSRLVGEAATLRDEIGPRSAEALEETERAYERGRYSYLELVDAQREYLEVRASLIDTAASAHILRAEIERLTNAPLVRPTP